MSEERKRGKYLFLKRNSSPSIYTCPTTIIIFWLKKKPPPIVITIYYAIYQR